MAERQVQDAEARFGEFLGTTLREGPQVVTRDGEEIAVLVPIAMWRRLQQVARPSLRQLLLAPAPRFEKLPLQRGRRCRRLPTIWGLLGTLGVALTCSACLCWFVWCDRGYYVAGRVQTSNGHPLGGAQVSMSWDLRPTATDAAGCFILRGLFAAPRFELTVEGPNFKPVRSTRRMGQYTVDVTLATADSPASSRMVFHEIPADAPRPTCSDGLRRRRGDAEADPQR
jgi:prevent-host-death family protein